MPFPVLGTVTEGRVARHTEASGRRHLLQNRVIFSCIQQLRGQSVLSDRRIVRHAAVVHQRPDSVRRARVRLRLRDVRATDIKRRVRIDRRIRVCHHAVRRPPEGKRGQLGIRQPGRCAPVRIQRHRLLNRLREERHL